MTDDLTLFVTALLFHCFRALYLHSLRITIIVTSPATKTNEKDFMICDVGYYRRRRRYGYGSKETTSCIGPFHFIDRNPSFSPAAELPLTTTRRFFQQICVTCVCVCVGVCVSKWGSIKILMPKLPPKCVFRLRQAQQSASTRKLT